MSDFAGLGDLVEQIKEASRSIEQNDARTRKRLEATEASINEFFRKTSRPAASLVISMRPTSANRRAGGVRQKSHPDSMS
jgi:hypothetical protein